MLKHRLRCLKKAVSLPFGRWQIVWLTVVILPGCSSISNDVATGWQSAKRKDVQFVLAGVYIGPKPIQVHDMGVDDIRDLDSIDNRNWSLKQFSWLTGREGD